MQTEMQLKDRGTVQIDCHYEGADPDSGIGSGGWYPDTVWLDGVDITKKLTRAEWSQVNEFCGDIEDDE